MEVGIRKAKSDLSKLVSAAQKGEEIYITSRGKRVAQLVPAPKPKDPLLGRGFLKGKINFYPGWDSPEEDKRIEQLFECLKEDSPAE